MAATGRQIRGLSMLQHRYSIKTLIERSGSKKVLDYGSGAGDAYRSPYKLHKIFGLGRADITLYDPAFPDFDKLPDGNFDLVICSDVLEHIPEHQIDELLSRLFSYADKAVWASVCCRPAHKKLPGTHINTHVTIKPFSWWQERFNAKNTKKGVEAVLVETL